MKRHYALITLPALAVIVLDQMTKFLIVRTIPLHGGISVIQGFFDLVHTRNRGMAFGILNRPGPEFGSYLLVLATLGAVALLIVWFFRLKSEDRGLTLALSLIIGGAVGNLIDRIRLGEVVDFLDVYVGGYHWPAFNVADSAITVGTLWLAIHILFRGEGKAVRSKQ